MFPKNLSFWCPTDMNPKTDQHPCRPWWRFPMVWMLIAGPLAVVVAGFFTAYIAIRSADPVIATQADRQAFEKQPAVKQN